RKMETAHRNGRVSDSFTGSSSTASLEEIESEDDLFSTYIDVEKLSGSGGISNGSVYAGNSDPHLHLLRRTLDLRNQAARKQEEEEEARRQYKRKEEEEEVVAAAQVKVARKKKKNRRTQNLRNKAAGEQEEEEAWR
ncbi:hypothetical protein PIB30_105758, partial [Stylosanthes scabra]|nr:hypothetical protein [Stylosanthes scabra]